MNLGDLSQDAYWYAHDMPINKAVDYVASLGFPAPIYSVSGNHDNDGGIWLGEFSTHHKPAISFHSYRPGGNNMFRAYDLNAVGHYYSHDNVLEYQRPIYPNRVNFASAEYTNKIMVNFWAYREGYTLEIVQNDTPLPVEQVKDIEDPLYNICVYAPGTLKSGEYKKSWDNISNDHMYMAQATDAKSPIVVRVRDTEDHIICSETMIRPKAFHKDAR
jgi:hypothetical protein